MKKTTLFAATALFTVLLASGIAQAQGTAGTVAATATATSKAAPAMMQDKMPMKGMMAESKMSEASKKLMKETMDKLHEDNKATFEAMKAKREEVQAIMKAPTFDKAAFLAKHEEMQTLHHKMATARHQAMATVLEKMTPEERAEMGMMKGRGMHHGMGKGGMGMGKMMENCPMMDGDDAEAPAPAPAAKK